MQAIFVLATAWIEVLVYTKRVLPDQTSNDNNAAALYCPLLASAEILLVGKCRNIGEFRNVEILLV